MRFEDFGRPGRAIAFAGLAAIAMFGLALFAPALVNPALVNPALFGSPMPGSAPSASVWIRPGWEPVFMAGAISCLLGLFALREIRMARRWRSHCETTSARLRELGESNRLLNLTETTARVGHWRLDLVDDAVFWSAGCFAIHGLEMREHDTPPPLDQAIDFFHPEDRSIVTEAVRKSRELGEAFTFRARLIGADGKTRHVTSTAMVEFDEAGMPSALVGIVADRTEEEEMQSELVEARNIANATAEAKSAFLAKMSHEIRTPMNAVMGFAELLGLSELQPEQRRHVDLIADAGKSLQTLLDDILDLSKIEAGKIELRSLPQDVPHIAARMVQLVEPLAREKAIEIAADLDPGMPRGAMLDGLRLRQILNNLLSNAIRFTDVGGIVLRVAARGDTLVFAVSDTGTGIHPAMHEAIFDAFRQDRGNEEKALGGTGLGLSISRQLAELMGGSLTLESVPGEGSTFTLILPFNPCEVPARKRAMAPLSGVNSCAGCSCRILLAEDYDINQELICEMGRRLGLQFELANDGEEALAKVISAREELRPYSLVLMDLQMPRMDGLEATRRIREAGFDADTLPVLALTANAFNEDADACLAAGMQEHIAKPLDMARLGEAMRRWLSGFSTIDAARPCIPGADMARESQPVVNSRLPEGAGSSGSRQHCHRFSDQRSSRDHRPD